MAAMTSNENALQAKLCNREMKLMDTIGENQEKKHLLPLSGHE